MRAGPSVSGRRKRATGRTSDPEGVRVRRGQGSPRGEVGRGSGGWACSPGAWCARIFLFFLNLRERKVKEIGKIKISFI